MEHQKHQQEGMGNLVDVGGQQQRTTEIAEKPRKQRDAISLKTKEGDEKS